MLNRPLTYIDPTGLDCFVPLPDIGDRVSGVYGPHPSCLDPDPPEPVLPGIQNYPASPDSGPADGGGGGPNQTPQQQISQVTVTGTCPGVGGNPLAFRQSAPNDPSRGYTPTHDLPPGSFIVTAPNGRRFNAPPNADFFSVYQYGSSLVGGTNIDGTLAWAHYFGSIFDFQRGNNQFNLAFSYSANYAIGIDFAAARQPLNYALALAALVKSTAAGGHGFAHAPEAITQGYTAASSGACTKK